MNISTQAIAQHLNLAEELILEVQEWARVLWVRIQGMRPRFISKKVVVTMELTKEQVEALVPDRGDISRVWRPEMGKLVPQLAALNPKNGPYQWLEQYAPYCQMEAMGWNGRAMNIVVEAAIALSPPCQFALANQK